MEPTVYWLLLIAGGALALVLAFFAVGWLISGAVVLFGWAATQGFVGLTAYVAAWVFLFPIMLVASLVTGLVTSLLLREQAGTKNRSRGTPPDDLYERYKWANRMPPYDE